MSIKIVLIVITICLACYLALHRRKKFNRLISEMTSISSDINRLTSELAGFREVPNSSINKAGRPQDTIINSALEEYIICAKGLRNHETKDKYIMLAMQSSLMLESGSVRTKIVEDFSERKHPKLNFDDDALRYRQKAAAYCGINNNGIGEQRSILRELACT